MTRDELYRLFNDGPVFLDGATGSNLIKVGMPQGVCPEKWIADNPNVIIDLQRDYVSAGSHIVYAPTFGANRLKLAEYGLESEINELNRQLVKLSKTVCDGRAYVAGDISMTGKQLAPVGDLDFEELVDIYKEQAEALYSSGVDLFVVETMMSLQESRAAVLAIREVCDLPIMVSLTYESDGHTMFGTPADVAMIVLQSLGADVVGLNCSSGPSAMKPLVEAMAKYARVPIMAKPNAGIPELIDGDTVYPMGPEEFAAEMLELVDAGVSVVGGCCGTTPEHIKALREKLNHDSISFKNPEITQVVTSERQKFDIDINGRFAIVGERINPTGKKKLQESLRSGSLDMVCDFAREQEEKNAAILDVNLGTNGIDELAMMKSAVSELSYTVDLPLCIDTSYVEVMEAALRIYPGRALINSISAEEEKLGKLLPVAKKYGAMIVLLPLADGGLPKDLDEKKANIDRIISEADKIGISRDSFIVDILVTTVAANPNAANECFEMVEYCKNELKLPTICGLSNISFGMPNRAFLNAAFLNIAMSKGLTMAIANPSQTMLVYSDYASDLLLNKDGAVDVYLENVTEDIVLGAKTSGASEQASLKDVSSNHIVFDCVLKGNKSIIVDEVKKLVDEGVAPDEIINTYLIPAINRVGELYDQKKYFLPQLIAGADTMQLAMNYLEPMLITENAESKETVIMATVKGDIHDIGKNICVIMLKNYGYNVIDLGKDVDAETIVEAAKKYNASIIGLSALMTTTMMYMKEIVEAVRESGVNAKVIIGGACITESFKDEIGADGYSSDAADCVKVVKKLLT